MQKIATDKLITIDYRMTSHLLDGTSKEHPQERISFIFGVDRQVPTLEKALDGSQVGQTHHLSIPPSEIYGAHDPELIREIPKAPRHYITVTPCPIEPVLPTVNTNLATPLISTASRDGA